MVTNNIILIAGGTTMVTNTTPLDNTLQNSESFVMIIASDSLRRAKVSLKITSDFLNILKERNRITGGVISNKFSIVIC